MASAAVTPAVPKGTAAALQLVKCKVSASLLPGNLVTGSNRYAYIHRSEVALVETRLVALGNEKADTIKSAYAEKEPVNQIEFCKFAGIGEVLVVVNQGGGVFLYDETGQKLLHSYKHVKASGGNLTLKEAHLRGIASDGKESLYVGTGSGDILVLQVSKAKIALSKVLAAGPDSHQESSTQGGGVSALAFNTQHSILASADDWGNVLLWSAASSDALSGKPVRAWSGAGSPVSVMAQGHGMLVAGFGTGHVRIFDLSRKGIVAEIAAHTRAINSVDVHASKAIVLAAAEDTFVSVWSLPAPGAQPQIKSLYTESPVLGLITGCRFGGAHGELIVTTSYDSRSLALMHTP